MELLKQKFYKKLSGDCNQSLWGDDAITFLIRVGNPNKPRPGSSAGKIGQTKVIGAKKVLKDFKGLIGTLQAMIRKHGKGNTKGLQAAYKSIRTEISH